ncbi:uncharacterized protein BDV17DRAFT_291203 [Aspergillus undulatus]|uniref:uncharacterized protein n=1 Tax=Aspergillus undulatus TaxID=1810928 RepID=UPI003CCD7376
MSIHIPPKFHMVTINRCRNIPRKKKGDEADDKLLLDDSSTFCNWKGVIATLLGTTAGVLKFKAGMKVIAAGFYYSHWLGMKLFGGYISTSAYMAAAGPAVGLALGRAAAVYFIPWGKLWAFFRRLVGTL